MASQRHIDHLKRRLEQARSRAANYEAQARDARNVERELRRALYTAETGIDVGAVVRNRMGIEFRVSEISLKWSTPSIYGSQRRKDKTWGNRREFIGEYGVTLVQPAPKEG